VPWGFANRGTAHRVVTKALAERLIDGIDELRDTEVARLDALQAALWPKVERGDTRAVNTVVRIIDRRCRLLGLYREPTVETPLWGLVVPPADGNARLATGAELDDTDTEVSLARQRDIDMLLDLSSHSELWA
jgi:hypothetical protein